MKILVVDDERPILDSIEYTLRREGYSVVTAVDADQALHAAHHERPDLILLDVMLPSGSGLDVCRLIRSGSSVPIILLTALAAETDKVVGLELGADDYVTKPFSMRELLARIRSVLRRASADGSDTSADVIVRGDLVIDSSRRTVKIGGRSVELTRKEFDLLAFMAVRPGQTHSRQDLLDGVWGPDAYVVDRTVDVHVRWLREKIEALPASPTRVLTVRGVGYKYSDA